MCIRKHILLIAAMALLFSVGTSRARPGGGRDASLYWWHRYPSFASVDGPALFEKTGARVAMSGVAIDPTWGPYAQHLTVLENRSRFQPLKRKSVPMIAWIEGVGDCMIYAAAFERQANGSFKKRQDDPATALVMRSHWSWAAPNIPQGNAFRWVGIHNTLNNEDFIRPRFTRERLGIPVPTYPDGRPAVGWLPGAIYPLNARIYDACGAKDINGSLSPAFELPAQVNDIDLATGKRKGPVEGLYPAVIGQDETPAVPGLKAGDIAYAGVISVHKDLSAPFWRQYVRHSIREIVKQGLDGVWCDNYSPWDNYGYPPVQKAFGDWSVYRFHQYLKKRFPEPALKRMGISGSFDIRRYLKAKATAFGAKDPSRKDDPAWNDRRWLDDPLWRVFKAFRQRSAQADLKAFYDTVHDEARTAGRPDFSIGGNDVPFYGLGWVRDGWLDMINTEITPGWHMGTGSRGVMIPPIGKMAPVYRAALEHQKGPFAGAWYYLSESYARYQENPEIAKVLMAEAFANGAFLLCDPSNKRVAGTAESHAWWNRFIRAHERRFGQRVPVADAGILFSPDNQLFWSTPGGFADMDRQPHTFGYYGWATALIDAHIPFRAVTDWKLNARSLGGLKTLILPDAKCLETQSARALTGWVRSGGRLILTGPSGTRFGPQGFFQRRSKPLFDGLLGISVSAHNAPAQKRVGKGTMIWLPDPVGMDYYLDSARRPALLSRMRAYAGASSMADGSPLPFTVGLSLWKARGGDALFCDLVNYNLNADADTVRPADDLSLRLRLPAGWRSARAATFSPDRGAPAAISVCNGWAALRLPRLHRFASLKITRA
ncbi:MAG: hypothetical protein IT210_07585 [Armatimonadetes bacterium]|nr:hypothetical protein [Armatimonadota bacterium]